MDRSIGPFVGSSIGLTVGSPTGPTADMLTGPFVDMAIDPSVGSSIDQIVAPEPGTRTGLSLAPLADRSLDPIAAPSFGQIADPLVDPKAAVSVGLFAGCMAGPFVAPSIGSIAEAELDSPLDRLIGHRRFGQRRGFQTPLRFQMRREGRVPGSIATLIQKSYVYEVICGSFPDLLAGGLRSVLTDWGLLLPLTIRIAFAGNALTTRKLRRMLFTERLGLSVQLKESGCHQTQ